jgi:hypothetical protein
MRGKLAQVITLSVQWPPARQADAGETAENFLEETPFISYVEGDSILERVTQRDSLSRHSLTGPQGEGKWFLSALFRE